MQDCFYYGIDCNGNNYYTAETNTYEMDGFKKPPDNDQLIDFFIKLCKDHPLLKYLEDPLSNNDLRGYSKLMDKFNTECPEVKIVLKRLVQDKLDNLSHIIDKEEENTSTKMNTLNPLYKSRLIHNEPRAEDIVDELTELEKKKKAEEEERKRKEEEEKKRQEEEEAKRLETRTEKTRNKKTKCEKNRRRIKKRKRRRRKKFTTAYSFYSIKKYRVTF